MFQSLSIYKCIFHFDFFQSLIVLVLNDVFERCRLENTRKSEKRSKKEHRTTTVFTVSAIEKCVVLPSAGNFLNAQREEQKRTTGSTQFLWTIADTGRLQYTDLLCEQKEEQGRTTETSRILKEPEIWRGAAWRVKFVRRRRRIYDRTVKILAIKKKTKENPAAHCHYNG